MLLHVLFHPFLGIAESSLRRADRLFDLAFQLLRGAARRLAGNFLDLTRGFFHTAVHLIFVDSHRWLLRQYRHAADPRTSRPEGVACGITIPPPSVELCRPVRRFPVGAASARPPVYVCPMKNDFPSDRFVRVRGAREHNLKSIDLDLPRDALVVFTGISGSGKSSLAFGTLYAEAQRRYFESVAPYARRLFHQMAVPEVDEIDGLPPAVALQQQRGSPTTRSSVGSVTTLSNLLRMLYSRAGDYPRKQSLLSA